MDFSVFDRLTNPLVRPASGNVRFIFKPLGVLATAVSVAFFTTGVPWLIAVAALPMPWRTLLFFVGLPLVLLAMHRALRVSVVADDAGLTVKNYWRRYVLPWGDITEVRGWAAVGGCQRRSRGRFPDDRRQACKSGSDHHAGQAQACIRSGVEGLF